MTCTSDALGFNHLVAFDLNICRFSKKAYTTSSMKYAKFFDLVFNNFDHSPTLMLFLQRH